MASRCWKWCSCLLQTGLIVSLLRDRPSAGPADAPLRTLDSDWTQHRAYSPSPWTEQRPDSLSSWTEQRPDSLSPGWKCGRGGGRVCDLLVCGDCDERLERRFDAVWIRGGTTSANERLVSTFELDLSTKTIQPHQFAELHLLAEPLKSSGFELSALGRHQWQLLEELNSLGRYDRLHTVGADIQAYQVTGGGTALLGQPEGGWQTSSGSDRTSPGRMSLREDCPQVAAPLSSSGRGSDAGAVGAVGADLGALEDASDGGEGDDASAEGVIDMAVSRQTLALSDPVMFECTPELPISDSLASTTSEKNSTHSDPSEASPRAFTSQSGSGTVQLDLPRAVPGPDWSPSGRELLPQTDVAPAGFSLWEMVDADLAEEEAEGTDLEAEKSEEAEQGAHRCPPESPHRHDNSPDDPSSFSTAYGFQHSPQYGHDHGNARHGPHGHGPEHGDKNGSGNSGGDEFSLEQTGLADASDAEPECCYSRFLKSVLWNASAAEQEPWLLDAAESASWDDVWRNSAACEVDCLVGDSAEWSPLDSDRLSSLRVESSGVSSHSAASHFAGSELELIWARAVRDPQLGSTRDPQWSSTCDSRRVESEESVGARDSAGNQTEASLSDSSLPDEDAEVIEALLQQDIDLGLTRHDFDPVRSPLEVDPVPEKSARLDDEWLSSKLAGPPEEAPEEDSLDKIWAGLDYTIDSETGEYMLLPSAAPAAAGPADPSPVVPPVGGPLSSPATGDSPREESLLSGPIPTTIDELMNAATAGSPQELTRRLPHSSGDSGQGSLTDSDSEIALLDRMIEAAGRSHSDTLQPRVPLNRMVSMEQRWQDLASVLLLPPGQDAPLPPPPATQQPPPPPQQQQHHLLQQQQQQRMGPIGGQTILQAGFLSETGAVDQAGLPLVPPLCLSPEVPAPALGDGGASGGEMTYFQLSPATVPPPPAAAAVAPPLDNDDAFLSQLLGVDQLDLSAVPITELAPQHWSASNQSVGGSPSQSPPGDHIQSSQSGLHGLGSGRSSSNSTGAGSDAHGRPPRLPVAQKKHQMYGKRFFQGQDGTYDDSSPSSDPSVSPCRLSSSPAPLALTQRYGTEGGLRAAFPPPSGPAPGQAATAGEPAEVKYSRMPQFTRMSPTEQLDTVAHNHSYHQPAAAESATDATRPVARDKVSGAAADKKPSERVSRDEKRLRSMDIPLSAEEIVNLPMDDFNERLAKLQLSEAQLSLVRDVRRRGKNKLAAQNCRKRKLDQITSLTEDLQKVRDQRQRMLSEHQFLTEERSRIRDKYAQLHRHVFQSLRDADDQPYSPSEYSLQLSADGDVLLVPRGPARGAAVVPSVAVAAAGRHKPLGLNH